MPKGLNLLLLIFLFIPIVVLSLYSRLENHYVYLAEGYINGSLSPVRAISNPVDFAYFDGKYFWAHGPFPAIILTPFVWLFGMGFEEKYLKLILTAVNFWLVFKIVQSLKISLQKAFWLAIFFIFGSIYTPLTAIPHSTYYLQVVVTTLVLFAILEFLGNRRYLLIGLAIGFATLSRITLILSLFFFLINLFKQHTKIPGFLKLIGPVIVAVFIIGLLNYLSFRNPLETGHRYRFGSEEFEARKADGLFSLKFVPTNLYYLFVKTPDPILDEQTHTLKFPYIKYDPYGMSIFFLSPILFLLFSINYHDRLAKLSLLTSLIIAIPILSYSGIGYQQIGYRYALDFMPFLLIPLAQVAKKTNLKKIQILVVLGCLATWFFIVERVTILNF